MIVRSKAKPGRRDALRAAWDKHLRAATEADHSRLLYLYCFDADDPDAHMLVEVFRDGVGPPPPDAPFFQEFMRDAGPLLDGMPVVQRAEVVWSKASARNSPTGRRSRLGSSARPCAGCCGHDP